MCVNIKYIVHIVADMHAPSHIYYSDLPGGINAKPRHYNFFPVSYKGVETTYHAIWDSPLKRLHPDWDEEQFRQALDTLSGAERKRICRGTPVDWAQDNADRCRVIYDWAKPGDGLDENFYVLHAELAVEQYRRAAYRLAFLLNKLFK